MIKLIATDMDGTLLKSDNTISPKTKHILIEAQKQGVRLVLASGRSYRKLMQYAQELEMPKYGGYLIEVNGTAVYDLANDKRIRYHELKKADDLIKDSYMIEHEKLDNGLTVVTYNNGVRFYINYSKKDIVMNGITVPAMSYKVGEAE